MTRQLARVSTDRNEVNSSTRADPVDRKLANLGISQGDVNNPVAWARSSCFSLLTWWKMIAIGLFAIILLSFPMPTSAHLNCAAHYPYKVIGGHEHDRDGDGVGCEANPLWPPESGSTISAKSAHYNRDSWDYNSSIARKHLHCTKTEHVDHIVALKEAYDSGANAWSLAQKKKFANDPMNQWCLDGGVNISKSDKDLAEWNGGSCEIRKFIADATVDVKVKYGLTIDPAEERANAAAIAQRC